MGREQHYVHFCDGCYTANSKGVPGVVQFEGTTRYSCALGVRECPVVDKVKAMNSKRAPIHSTHQNQVGSLEDIERIATESPKGLRVLI